MTRQCRGKPWWKQLLRRAACWAPEWKQAICGGPHIQECQCVTCGRRLHVNQDNGITVCGEQPTYRGKVIRWGCFADGTYRPKVVVHNGDTS